MWEFTLMYQWCYIMSYLMTEGPFGARFTSSFTKKRYRNSAPTFFIKRVLFVAIVPQGYHFGTLFSLSPCSKLGNSVHWWMGRRYQVHFLPASWSMISDLVLYMHEARKCDHQAYRNPGWKPIKFNTFLCLILLLWNMNPGLLLALFMEYM